MGILKETVRGWANRVFFFRGKQPTPSYSRTQIKILILIAISGDELFCLIRALTS